MKNIFFPILILFPLLFDQCGPITESSDPISKTISISNWEFKQNNQDSIYYRPATVPGTVLPNLVKLGDIPDPFLYDHENELQWIDESAWDYKSEFTLDPDLLLHHNISLVFEGLDTYAEVFLNGHKILSAENMFVKYEIAVKNYLIEGKNELILNFSSPVIQDSLKQAKHPFLYPDSRSFTRKAPYQYGWDWGPRLLDMGIWRPVYLKLFDEFEVDQIRIVTDSISEKQAFSNIVLDISSSISIDVDVSANLKLIPDAKIEQRLNLLPGKQRIQIPLVIEEPILWWPNGMGDSYLYELDLSIASSSGILDTLIRFGIREIDLVQEKDSIGTSFYFTVNNKALFIRGSNYIPRHSFPSEVEKQDTRKLLTDAALVGMNMVRVWGGGIYPENEFYDLCDSLGLLLWQDFMFACNFYPGNHGFIDNISKEINQQVERLDGRTCMALWCGNNEIDEAWHNWGYQESLDYSLEDQDRIWGDYQAIFDTLIPGIIRNNGMGTDYIPSSPKIGWGNEEALYAGDMHYWGVWWGEEPFEKYREKTGRFMSEYGFQSFPSMQLMDAFFYKDSLILDHPYVLNHQKHPRGMELISKYMNRDFNVPSDAQKFAYVSQLVQRRGMRIAIEAHRLKKPDCMGTLYWQLNDCWPAISWSSIDYAGRWKAFHYDLERLYGNQILIFEEEGENIKAYLINEDPAIKKCNIQIQITDFEGKIYLDSSSVYDSPHDSRQLTFVFEKKDIKRYLPLTNLFFDWKIIHRNRLLSGSKYFPSKPRELALKKAVLEVAYFVEDDQHYLQLHSDQLIKDLYLYRPGTDLVFDRNYFDILGEERLMLNPGKEQEDLGTKIKDLQLFSLNPVIQLTWVEK